MAGSAADDEAEKAFLRGQITALRALKQSLAPDATGPITVGSLVLDVLTELVDDSILEVIFDFHRMVRLGLVCPCVASSAAHKYVT